MKWFAVLCLVAVAAAAPQDASAAAPEVTLVRYENNYTGDNNGAYNYLFELSDGTKQESRGELRNADSKDGSFYSVQGSFEWVGPDGVTYTVKYTADDKGYRPEISQGPGGAVPAGIVALLG